MMMGMNTTTKSTLSTVMYSLSEHPSIVNFRWSHTQSYGSTWSFLVLSILSHLTLSLLLHHLLLRLRTRPIPLGPLPHLHSLLMALLSATTFAGILLSSAAEIRDIRWFWRRTKTTPFQWLLCFPLGTRSSGRVFFWTYIFYLTRFVHLLRTYFVVFRRRRLSFFHLFSQSFQIFMTFLWLEFSQSFQILGVLVTTAVYSVVYGYRFWVGVGLPGGCDPFVVNCQIVGLGCNVLCHVGVLSMHLMKGGCNGIGAWVFNSAILLLFLNFYFRKEKVAVIGAGGGGGGGGIGGRSEVEEVKEKDV